MSCAASVETKVVFVATHTPPGSRPSLLAISLATALLHLPGCLPEILKACKANSFQVILRYFKEKEICYMKETSAGKEQ